MLCCRPTKASASKPIEREPLITEPIVQDGVRDAHLDFEEIEETSDLFKAVMANDTDEFEKLLLTGEFGPDDKLKSEGSRTALHFAAINGNAKICRMLAVQGADMDARDQTLLKTDEGMKESLRTPLHYAALYGRTEVVEFLIGEGCAQIQPKDGMNCTPEEILVLMHALLVFGIGDDAVKKNQEEFLHVTDEEVTELSKRKDDYPKLQDLMAANVGVILAKDEGGEMLVHKAARAQDCGEMEKLLKAFPDTVDERDNNGQTPLHKVVKRQGPKTTKGIDLLLDYNADIDAQAAQMGLRPLQMAAIWNADEIVHLIKRGAAVNLTDHSGFTALHYACHKANPQSVMTLLRNGADPTVLSNDGRSVQDMAGDSKEGTHVKQLLAQQAAQKQAHRAYQAAEEEHTPKHTRLSIAESQAGVLAETSPPEAPGGEPEEGPPSVGQTSSPAAPPKKLSDFGKMYSIAPGKVQSTDTAATIHVLN